MNSRKFSLVIALQICFCLAITAQRLYNKFPYGSGLVNGVKGGFFEILDSGKDTSYLTGSGVNSLYTVASICDTSGNLLFYTNGISVFGKDHQILENGDSLSYGKYWSQLSKIGLSQAQGIQIIPKPGVQDEYIIVHQVVGDPDSDTLGLALVKLLTTEVIKNQVGQYVVKNKNLVIHQGMQSFFGMFKHGNGLDYWIFTSDLFVNNFYFYLISSSGTSFHHKQDLPLSTFNTDQSMASPCVSPDGQNMLRFNLGYEANVGLYAVDRWKGFFNDETVIPIDTLIKFGSGSCFSPDSRKAYIASRSSIYQIDLDDTPIKLIEVAHSYDPVKLTTSYFAMELMPNNKIYICKGILDSTMHGIEQPNEKGVACQFKENHIKLAGAMRGAMPRIPNPYLGKLDTLSSTSVVDEAICNIVIYPNPSKADITIVTNLPKSVHLSKAQIKVFNAMGGEVYSYEFNTYSDIHVINERLMSNGSYFATLIHEGKVVKTVKFEVMK